MCVCVVKQMLCLILNCAPFHGGTVTLNLSGNDPEECKVLIIQTEHERVEQKPESGVRHESDSHYRNSSAIWAIEQIQTVFRD